MKFSIIVPVYNVERYIRRCLDSIMIQNDQDFEVLVINDGSSDTSGAICEEYEKQYDKVKVYHQKNKKLSEARNTGIRYAKGEYLLFVDSDDFFLHSNVISLLQKAVKDQADIVLFPFARYDEKDQWINTVDYSQIHEATTLGEVYLDMYEHDVFYHNVWIRCYKHEIFQQHHLSFYPGIIGEDTRFLFESLPYFHTYAMIDQPCYGYRIREGSLSYSPDNQNVYDLLETIKYYPADIKQLDIAMTAFQNEYLAYLYVVMLMMYVRIKKPDRRLWDEIVKEKKRLSYHKKPLVHAIDMTQKLVGMSTVKVVLRLANQWIRLKNRRC